MKCTECGAKCKVTDECVDRTFYVCPSCFNEFDRPAKPKRALALNELHLRCLGDIDSLGMPGVPSEKELEKAGFIEFRLMWELTANGQVLLLALRAKGAA